jgi:hypothetical protein
MKNFFKKLAAIACKFNIVFRRHETSNDEADTEFDFTLDGVCYTLYTKEIPPANYGDKRHCRDGKYADTIFTRPAGSTLRRRRMYR